MDHLGGGEYVFDENGDYWGTLWVNSIQFGSEQVSLRPPDDFFWSSLGELLPEDATVHFRNCNVAVDPDQLQLLANLIGRRVTGVMGDVVDLMREILGPDYKIEGMLWGADPNGAQPYVKWAPQILDHGNVIPNPDPQPY